MLTFARRWWIGAIGQSVLPPVLPRDVRCRKTQGLVAGFDTNGNPIFNVRFNNNSGNQLWIASGPTNATGGCS